MLRPSTPARAPLRAATAAAAAGAIFSKASVTAVSKASVVPCATRLLSSSTSRMIPENGNKMTSSLCRPLGAQERYRQGRGGGNTTSIVAGQRRWKSMEEMKSRYRSGPFSWKAGGLFVLTGVLLLWFFESEKERMKRKRMAESNKGYGKARVGGPFELIDTNGNKFTDEDLKGRYSLVYFGFTHCPDICPEELDKMATMYDIVEKSLPGALLPVFITCDPARDDPQTLGAYLREFHHRFVGLTGTYEQVKATCKAYRVYFSTPEKVKPGEDYLVDHSIYFYIMDPEGEFVEVLGRQHSPQEGAKVILTHMKDWKGEWRIPK